MKKLSKITAILMALALMFVYGISAFANNTGTLTVTGDQLPGKSVQAIRMFDASWVDTNNDGKIDSNDTISYTLESAWEGFFTDAMLTGVTGETRSEKAFNYLKDMQDDSAALNAFADAAAAYARTHTTDLASLTSTQAADTTDTRTFANLDAGYYLVLPEGGSTSVNRQTDAMLVNVPSAKATALNLKSAYPTVDKTVDNGKKETSAQIGDTVTFTLTSAVPEMSDYSSYTFKFVDTMSAGLDYVDDSVVVTAGGKTISPSYYNVNYNSTTHVLTVAFEDTKNLKNAKTGEGAEEAALVAGEAFVVTYDAILNENAQIGSTGNLNEAKVVYSNDPVNGGTGESLPSDSTVYTYDIIIHKYHDEDIATNRLGGAVFELRASDAANAPAIPLISLGGNEYRVAKANEAGAVTQVTTPSDGDNKGIIKIKGLEAGTYYLYEITAPTGYNKLNAPVTITIAPQTTGTGAEATVDYSVPQYTVGTGTASDSDVIPVENKGGSLLPSTGGYGTIGLTVIGTVAIIGGVMMTTRKKKANA